MGHDVHVLTTARHAFDGSLDLDYDLSGLSIHTTPFLGKTSTTVSTVDASARGGRTGRWERLKIATRALRLGFGMFGEIASLAYASLLRRGVAILDSDTFDFIVSTSPPEVTHFVAHALSVRTGSPWLADYRDLWFPEMRLHHFRWVAALTGLANRRLLKNAAVVSTVSRGLAARLETFLGRPIHICYNGFFSEASTAPRPRPWADEKVHIVYTGRLYPQKRDPTTFFCALGQALRTGPDLANQLTVDIYGYDESWLYALIAQYGVAGCVHLHGFVSHDQSLAAQQHADYLLFVDWMDDMAEGILTGKLFEYLASGRPIICVGTRDDSEAAGLIRDVRAGVVLTEVRDIQAYLGTTVHHSPVTRLQHDLVKPYSRREQASMLLDVMRATKHA
jgi:glycosyltransferase involved in cell wall biosynthesis